MLTGTLHKRQDHRGTQKRPRLFQSKRGLVFALELVHCIGVTGKIERYFRRRLQYGQI